MPGKGAIFNKDNTTILTAVEQNQRASARVSSVANVPPAPQKHYFSGALEKKGQGVAGMFNKYQQRYTSEEAYNNEEPELGSIETDSIVNLMTSDSYSNIVTKKNEIHIVRMDNGKEETRELRHPDEAEGWKEIRQWFKGFAAEGVDRAATPLEENRTWVRHANAYKMAKLNEEKAAAEEKAAWQQAKHAKVLIREEKVNEAKIEQKEQAEGAELEDIAAQVRARNAAAAEEAEAVLAERELARSERSGVEEMHGAREGAVTEQQVKDFTADAVMLEEEAAEKNPGPELAEIRINEIEVQGSSSSPKGKRGCCAKNCIIC